MTDADKEMNPLHFWSDPADALDTISLRIRIADHFWLRQPKFKWSGHMTLVEICSCCLVSYFNYEPILSSPVYKIISSQTARESELFDRSDYTIGRLNPWTEMLQVSKNVTRQLLSWCWLYAAAAEGLAQQLRCCHQVTSSDPEPSLKDEIDHMCNLNEAQRALVSQDVETCSVRFCLVTPASNDVNYLAFALRDPDFEAPCRLNRTMCFSIHCDKLNNQLYSTQRAQTPAKAEISKTAFLPSPSLALKHAPRRWRYGTKHIRLPISVL